jgi:hypothetical protein
MCCSMSWLSNSTVVAVALALIGCGTGDDGVPAEQQGLSWQPDPRDAQAWRATDRMPPTVSIAASRVVDAKGMVALRGMAADDQRLQRVRWSNNRGGSGQAVLTGSAVDARSWAASVALQWGDNTITVTAFDATGNQTQTSTVVTRTHGAPGATAARAVVVTP